MNAKCVVLNAKKMNFDGKLDFSILSSDVAVYDDTTEQQLSERIQGVDIIVTKEMSVSAEMIQKFPKSVKLICEAGIGYNNSDRRRKTGFFMPFFRGRRRLMMRKEVLKEPTFEKEIAVMIRVSKSMDEIGSLITTVNDLVAVVTYYGLAWLLLLQVFKIA